MSGVSAKRQMFATKAARLCRQLDKFAADLDRVGFFIATAETEQALRHLQNASRNLAAAVPVLPRTMTESCPVPVPTPDGAA